MSVNKRIAKDSIITTIVTFGMQFTAFVVSLYVAWIYGLNVRTDVYFLALSIPAVFNAGLFGALKAVFIPVFTSYKAKNPTEEKQMLGSMYFSILLLSVVVFWIMYSLAPYYLPLITKGFDPASRDLSIQLTRGLLPLIILSSMVGVLSSVYNSYQKFVVPIITPVFRTIVLFLFVKFTHGSLGINSLVYGTVVGELVQLFIIGFAVKKAGIYIGLNFSFHPAFRKMARLSIPPIIGNIVLELNPLIDKIMITSMAVGSVTALNYAVKFNDIPIMLLSSGGFMTVILSHWSKLKADTDMKEVTRSLEQTISMLTFVIAPFITAVFVLKTGVIELFYERGKFTQANTETTALLLGILILGVVPLILGRVFTRVFFVMQDTKTPFWVGISRTFLNVVCNFIFRAYFGLAGIALSTTFSTIILTMVSFAIVRKRLLTLNTKLIMTKLTLIFMISIVSGVVMYYVYPLSLELLNFITPLEVHLFVSLALSTMLGLGIYVIGSKLWLKEEFNQLFRIRRGRF